MEEIVRRLRYVSPEAVQSLKEASVHTGPLYEEDDDDELEDEELDKETTEDGDEEPQDHSKDGEENKPVGRVPHLGSGGGTPHKSSPPSKDDAKEEDKPIVIEKDDKEENANPLDNQYAVKFKLGDSVSLAYANGTSTDVKATIEGYDKEGFYRIKLDSGKTINGLTDMALASVVKAVEETTCVCGSTEFVEESCGLVCDTCGRRIREGMDQLTKLDKARPKGQRMIRSIPHAMSTATRPNIADAGAAMGESVDEDAEDNDPYSKLKDELDGEFWTRADEMKEEIEDLGYDVLELNSEYVVVATPEDYDEQLYTPIGGTARTITLDFNRSKML